MHELDDNTLLREFAERGSEPAFAELVARHVNKVYSVALRHTRNPHSADEITQAVFVILARKAGKLGKNVILSGWLYQTARLTAVTLIRSDIRRAQREQEVLMQNLSNESATNPWPHIAPLLDDAMAGLSETDRHAVVLRYFDGKSLKEVGAALGGSEDAAKMRVNRAVEKLRACFTKRGVALSAAGLTTALAANSVQSAPIGLAAAVTTAALSGTALTTSAVLAATKTIAMTTLQKTLITVTIAALAGAGIYEARQAAQLREQNQTLQQQQAEQFQALQHERDDATNRLAVLLADNSRLKSNPNQAELLKLRGEVAALRNGPNDPDHKAFKELENRVKSLRRLVEQRLDKQIPELQFLTDKVWADVAWNADLDTEDGIRVALSNLRGEAENIFLNEMLHNALKKHLAANNDILPASLLDLKSFFSVPVTDAMLSRYELLQAGKPDPQADLVKLGSYTDVDYDSFHTITLNGASGGGFNRNQDAINDAAREFTRLNNYQSPTNPAQIAPFLSRVIDPVTIQKYLNQFEMDQPSPDEIIMAPVLHSYFMANSGARPTKGADLLPYITTPEQQAAFQRLEGKSK